MEQSYTNTNGERVVEVDFICKMINKYAMVASSILDVGGVPTDPSNNRDINRLFTSKNLKYDICDFRGGRYVGNFVELPIEDKYDIVIFLSSLEHFPLCTEGDMVFRENEDINGFRKALSILKDDGKIFLTVPFGEPTWQPYHQNYDISRIYSMSSGSKLLEHYTYKLCYDNSWLLTEPTNFKNIFYTNKAFGVGCFVFQKELIWKKH